MMNSLASQAEDDADGACPHTLPLILLSKACPPNAQYQPPGRNPSDPLSARSCHHHMMESPAYHTVYFCRDTRRRRTPQHRWSGDGQAQDSPSILFLYCNSPSCLSTPPFSLVDCSRCHSSIQADPSHFKALAVFSVSHPANPLTVHACQPLMCSIPVPFDTADTPGGSPCGKSHSANE